MGGAEVAAAVVAADLPPRLLGGHAGLEDGLAGVGGGVPVGAAVVGLAAVVLAADGRLDAGAHDAPPGKSVARVLTVSLGCVTIMA